MLSFIRKNKACINESWRRIKFYIKIWITDRLMQWPNDWIRKSVHKWNESTLIGARETPNFFQ